MTKLSAGDRHRVTAYLDDHPGSNPKEISTGTGLGLQFLKGQLPKLARKGLIEQHKNEGRFTKIHFDYSTKGAAIPARRVYVQGFAIRLDGQGDDSCPRCIKGNLLRDSWDICCLACGWRESFYFGQDTNLDAVLVKQLMYNSVDVL